MSDWQELVRRAAQNDPEVKELILSCTCLRGYAQCCRIEREGERETSAAALPVGSLALAFGVMFVPTCAQMRISVLSVPVRWRRR